MADNDEGLFEAALERVELDEVTKRPRLAADEMELAVADGVRVLAGKKEVLSSGVLRLTSHRVCHRAGAGGWWFLAHSRVAAVEERTAGGLFARKAQIEVRLTGGGEARVEFAGAGRETVVEQWRAALRRGAWQTKVEEKKEAFSAAGAGVTGLMRRAEERSASEAKSLGEAFSDLDALVGKADELAKLAKRLQKVVSGSGEQSDVVEMMGIVSTKENSGAMYVEEVARSVCGFLLAKGAASQVATAGMISLTDVYCSYNRARGTLLVSPHDLLQACLMMESLDLPLRHREFASGVRVLEMRGTSPAERMRLLFEQEKKRGRAVFEVAEALGVSMAVAMEQLLLLEQERALVRDDTFRGLVFFYNIYWNT